MRNNTQKLDMVGLCRKVTKHIGVESWEIKPERWIRIAEIQDGEVDKDSRNLSYRGR
jgi:hypothetical protein